jgi:hypothetical protein
MILGSWRSLHIVSLHLFQSFVAPTKRNKLVKQIADFLFSAVCEVQGSWNNKTCGKPHRSESTRLCPQVLLKPTSILPKSMLGTRHVTFTAKKIQIVLFFLEMRLCCMILPLVQYSPGQLVIARGLTDHEIAIHVLVQVSTDDAPLLFLNGVLTPILTKKRTEFYPWNQTRQWKTPLYRSL